MKVLVDGNSVGFAQHNAAKLTVDGQEVQAIFGFMRSIRKMKGRYHGAEIIVLWDGASWRKNVFADYKAKRSTNAKMSAMRDAYKAQRPFIARGLKNLGVTQMISANLEADDLAGILVPRIVKRGEKVLMISGDQDWMQLVQEGVVWFDQIRDRICNIDTFKEVTGFATQQQFVEGKAIEGDTSDEIPGVPGIGKKCIVKIMEEYGSVFKFLDAGVHESGTVPAALGRWRKKLCDFSEPDGEGRKILKRNLELMDLRDPSAFPKPEKLTIHKSKFNEDGFTEFCAELAFHSILKDMDNWKTSFAA